MWRIGKSGRCSSSRSVGVQTVVRLFPARALSRLHSLAVLGVFTAATFAAEPALAQGTNIRASPAKGFAAIIGVVDDSLRGGPLRGATIAVIGTSLRTTVDREGYFRIDSIPPGEAQLAVLHPLFDTLFLAVTSPKFMLVAGQLEELVIASPPLARVHERMCPRGGVATGRAMLTGRVDGADDDQPMVGAVVSLVYVDPASGTPIQRVRTARTRDDGLYVICGLPETLNGTVQASVGVVSSSEIAVVMKEQLLMTASFLIGVPSKDSTVRGSAILTGRVTDVTGAPMAQAQVAVEGGAAVAVTSTDGTFALRGLPSGTTSAVVRKIGYSPAFRTVHLRAAEPQRLVVSLAAGVRALPTVTITGTMEAALKKLGFNDRRNMASRSAFMLPADIDKRMARNFTDLFRTMNGFRVTDSGMGQMIEATRSSMGGGQAGCVNVYVDRVAFQQMSPGDLDSAFPVNMIGAIETYASGNETPAEFTMTGRGCATIVAWTKMKLAKP